MIVQSDFTAWKTVLQPAVIGADGKETAPEVAIKYGDFVSAIIYFLVVAFIMFIIVKAVAAAKKVNAAEEAALPKAPPAQEILLGEIRDLLKSGR